MSRQGFDTYLIGGAALCLLLAAFTIAKALGGKSSWLLPLSWLFMGGVLMALRAQAEMGLVYALGFLTVACLVGDMFMRAGRRAG